MTFKDILITQACNSEGVYNFDNDLIIDSYFRIFDISYYSLSDEEQRERVKNCDKIRYNFENRPSYILKIVSKYRGLLYTNINEITIANLLSKYWLVDEKQNITLGVCTDWQFDLFCNDFDIKIRRVQENVIKNLEVGDERDTYIDLISMKNRHKKLVELRADMISIRVKEPNSITTTLDIDLLNIEINCLADLIKANSSMTQDHKENYKKYTKELDSFEFETVNYDWNNDVVYDDNTFKPIQLFRLPKYNQFKTEYEKLIDSLAKDAYEEVCFWDIESKKNALKLLNEKKLRFKDYWEFENKYYKLISENSTDFDYIRFMLSFFSLFDIKVKNEGFVTNDGFSGNYGLVTIYAIEDLHEALMNKDSSLDWLINRLESNLGLSSSKQPPATEQRGFDLGLTDDNKIIYKHIEHLKGVNFSKDKIMSDENFERLFRDLCYLVEKNALPTFEKPLPQIGVSNQSLIYTFNLVHKELFTTRKIKDSFIEFLQKYFSQLSEYRNMKAQFSKKPPKNYPF